MRRLLLSTVPVLVLGTLALSGCDGSGGGKGGVAVASVRPAITADAMASHDPGPGRASDADQTDEPPRPIMKVQVVLDRLGFSPGVVDGTMSHATVNALLGLQAANGLALTGVLDDATMTVLSRWSQIGATRLVTIPADFAAGPFAPLPADPVAQARLPVLGYASLEEKLAERFHTSAATLRALNGGAAFAAGQTIRVPNVGADAVDATRTDDLAWLRTLAMLGVGTDQPALDRIVVSRSRGTLSGHDPQGKLVALFTVTTGSTRSALPLGNWKIIGIDHNPRFHDNANLFRAAAAGKPKGALPAGPNGPVGVVWIGLSKDYYGFHGTAEPDSVGHAASEGAVRLTNWDAARLAQMVSTSTRVEFVP